MSKKKKRRIIPRALQVLVKPDPKEDNVLESGIINPDSVEQEQKAVGTVLAVGEKINDIKEGSRVIYGAFAGEIISFREGAEEVEYKLLHDEDVLAFLEDE